MGAPLVALAAILIELAFAYPAFLYSRIGHPVGWIAALLQALERVLNRQAWSFAARRGGGVATLAIVLGVVGLVAVGLQVALLRLRFGGVAASLCVAVLLAPRSLANHVDAVRHALASGGIADARRAVARIVGRNPDLLDEAGVCRAAIESLAENFSDGVIAPLFWYLAGGLAGIALYKAVNTADSIMGHRNARYEAFGWAAARLDDLVNLPAARLTALLIACAAGLTSFSAARRAALTAWRDAPRHRSPNAGWPEAAMAGALELSLGGPRAYEGYAIDGAWLGEGSRDARADDIARALSLYHRALWLIIVMLGLAAISRL